MNPDDLDADLDDLDLADLGLRPDEVAAAGRRTSHSGGDMPAQGEVAARPTHEDAPAATADATHDTEPGGHDRTTGPGGNEDRSSSGTDVDTVADTLDTAGGAAAGEDEQSDATREPAPDRAHREWSPSTIRIALMIVVGLLAGGVGAGVWFTASRDTGRAGDECDVELGTIRLTLNRVSADVMPPGALDALQTGLDTASDVCDPATFETFITNEYEPWVRATTPPTTVGNGMDPASSGTPASTVATDA